MPSRPCLPREMAYFLEEDGGASFMEYTLIAALALAAGALLLLAVRKWVNQA